ncbi:MAG: Imm74 family immunity protein [Methylocystis sp.]|uniref:Imm74 family immunity protein n=1 Tax=Methylocystis sp. TaxID=1911079 RepID=UPI003D12A725
MARRASGYQVEVTEGAIRVRRAGKTLTIPAAPPDAESDEDADFMVRLDDLDHWDAPDDETPIEVDELQKILDAVEKQLDKHGLSVDFE